MWVFGILIAATYNKFKIIIFYGQTHWSAIWRGTEGGVVVLPDIEMIKKIAFKTKQNRIE